MSVAEITKAICTNRVHYWITWVFDALCPITLWCFGARLLTGASLATCIGVVASVAVGAFIFTFIEYGLHRWLFHAPASFATPSHAEHHHSPRDLSALPFFLSGLGTFIIFSLASLVIGTPLALFLAGATHGAYFFYGALHQASHLIKPGDVPFAWLRARWAAHAVHHAHPDRNFGVTTSFWDHVFGTYHPKRVPAVTSPRRPALP
jgi:sterol desaturase/sphingolipid hydroxylase (fatty acid hydroxylase superfamily)